MTTKEMISIILAICCSCANDFAWSTVRWALLIMIIINYYDNKFGQPGGWMRIANVDMKNNQLRCPPDWSTVSLTERGRLGQL